MARFYETGNLRPALAFIGILLAYLACIAAIGLVPWLTAKVLLGIPLCVLTGKLFLIGHDACHGSFARKRILSELIARLSLASSFHVFRGLAILAQRRAPRIDQQSR